MNKMNNTIHCNKLQGVKFFMPRYTSSLTIDASDVSTVVLGLEDDGTDELKESFL